MGGNALKTVNVESVRLDADEYFREINQLVDTLNLNHKAEFKLISAYRNKPNFGDADILVRCESTEWEKILTSMKDLPHYKNGKVFSFGHKLSDGRVFQVDLIYCGNTKEGMNCEMDYYCFNDLGNLVGRLAHLLGFKYGHQGLVYVIRDPENHAQVVDELTITRDTKTIHEFLGLDHSRYQQGFDDLEDIFKWVSSSRFFHPRIYLLENVNAVSRVRDAKRKTYTAFLEWSGALDASQYTEYVDATKSALRKATLYGILANDAALGEKYNRVMAKFYRYHTYKTLFNGDIVREVTGYNGKELGNFMLTHKEKFSQEFVLANPRTVKDLIKSLM